MQTIHRGFVVPSIADGYTPVAGLLNADFNKEVILNGVEQGTVPTVIEVAAGLYSFSYTFSPGHWTIVISNDANTYRTVYFFDISLLTIDDERPQAL